MKRKDLVRISKTARPNTYEQRRAIRLRGSPRSPHPYRFVRKTPDKMAS